MKTKGCGTAMKKQKFFKVMHYELYRMISKKPQLCIIILLLGLVEALLLLGHTVILKKFFEDIAYAVKNNMEIYYTIKSLGILSIILISSDIFNAISNYITEKQRKAVTGVIMEAFFHKIRTVKVIEFEEPEMLDTINKAKAGIGNSINLLIKTELIISNFGVYFVLIFVYLFKLHPLLSIVIWCIFIPTLISYSFRNKIKCMAEEKLAVERRRIIAYEAYIGERKFFKETRQLKATDFFKEKLLLSLKEFNKLILKSFNKINTIKLILNIIYFTGFIIILGILYYLVLIKAISVGAVGAVLITVKLIYDRMEELFNFQLADISEAYNGLYNLHYMLEREEEQKGEKLNGESLEICFKDVSFRYPNADSNTLKNISINIKPKEIIAIVGENGSGKTTLSKLISGIYQPSEGDIFYNDISIHKLDISSLFKKVTVVFQNFQQYALSVRENVAIADTDNIDNKKVEESLKSVDLAYMVNNFDEGLDTLLSREFGGTDLSLGQWQRIAIARANYKNASLIVFDEPTASLDPLQEMDIMKKFVESTKDKTAILVTHRIGAAKLADRIITMKNGQIVESGTHQELLKKQGEYAKLYTSQKQWYE